MTDSRAFLADVRADHFEDDEPRTFPDDPTRYCGECHTIWPCPTTRIVAALTAVLDLADEHSDGDGGTWRINPCDVRAAIAAALAPMEVAE